jgi:hypothetical protein
MAQAAPPSPKSSAKKSAGGKAPAGLHEKMKEPDRRAALMRKMAAIEGQFNQQRAPTLDVILTAQGRPGRGKFQSVNTTGIVTDLRQLAEWARGAGKDEAEATFSPDGTPLTVSMYAMRSKDAPGPDGSLAERSITCEISVGSTVRVSINGADSYEPSETIRYGGLRCRHWEGRGLLNASNAVKLAGPNPAALSTVAMSMQPPNAQSVSLLPINMDWPEKDSPWFSYRGTVSVDFRPGKSDPAALYKGGGYPCANVNVGVTGLATSPEQDVLLSVSMPGWATKEYHIECPGNWTALGGMVVEKSPVVLITRPDESRTSSYQQFSNTQSLQASSIAMDHATYVKNVGVPVSNEFASNIFSSSSKPGPLAKVIKAHSAALRETVDPNDAMANTSPLVNISEHPSGLGYLGFLAGKKADLFAISNVPTPCKDEKELTKAIGAMDSPRLVIMALLSASE